MQVKILFFSRYNDNVACISIMRDRVLQPIHQVGSVFKTWWVGLGWVELQIFFFIAGRVGFRS